MRCRAEQVSLSMFLATVNASFALQFHWPTTLPSLKQVTHLESDFLTVSVWVFCILLPFQLVQLFGWVTIPASMITAYILFGLLNISYQIENPFGYDINDLDLDRYCRGLAIDLDLITSNMPGPDPKEWLYSVQNHPLWPLQRSVSFNETDKMGVETVKERLDERRRRVMELWGKGLDK